MSLISLCHMNRPMAFSLRSHVTLIRFRNINKAVKIKSQHQSPIRWKCHNYSQNALHHCRRGFRDQSKINESTIHHISIWSQRCVTISYLQSNLVSYQRMARANLNKNENLMTNTTATPSKYIPKRPRICSNWNSSFQNLKHKLAKSNVHIVQ